MQHRFGTSSSMQFRQPARTKSHPAVFHIKLAVAIVTALYIASLRYCYIKFLNPLYSNLGFHQYNPREYNIIIEVISVLIVMSITFIFPVIIRRYSDFAALFIFYLLFIPIMIYVPMQGDKVGADMVFIVTLSISFLSILLIPRLSKKRHINRFSIKIPKGFYHVFFVLYGMSIVYLLSVYGGHIQLVGTADVIGQRIASGVLASGTYAGYVLGWVLGFFNPFLLAVGLFEKKKLMLIIAVVGQVFVYSIAAHKFVLVATLASIILYYFFIKRRYFMPLHFVLLVTAGVGLPAAVVFQLGNNPEWPISEVLATILMRTYGVQAVSTGWFFEFFARNPWTYYSHINIVALFVEYPYGDYSLGQVIGWEWTQSSGFNVSANFWAKDGFAAAGEFGVIAIGVVIGLLLFWVNTVCPREKLTMMCTATIMPLTMLIETHLTAVLLTGGAGFLYAFLIYWQPEYRGGRNAFPGNSEEPPHAR